jgi:DNA repair exonuclease SbcCD ATPase subunit
MKIRKIEWKNFSSYGNKKQSLEFPETPSLFQIIGENGAGKTTISQVIAFCLYGKVEGKKLGDIPNRINGNTWTKIEFESNQKYISVERGLEPSFFSLYIDGIKYDQAGNKNIQDYLTDDLIGIPYYVFNNTISLSINDFKSFVKMSPQDKRAIVDKIFGFHILNQMRETLKKEFKRITDALSVSVAKVETIQSSIEKSTNEMNLLLDSIQEESDGKIEKLNESLQKFLEIHSLHSERVKEFKIEEASVLKLLTDANRNLIDSRTEYQSLERRLKLYENKKCPTCESPLDNEFHSQIKDNLIKEKDTAFIKKSDIETELEKIRQAESEIRKKKTDLYEKGLKIETRVKEIKTEIEREKSSDKNKQIESLKKIVQNLEKDRDVILSQKFQTEEKNLWIKKLDDILSERGVKQMAIKTILPSLNSEIFDLLREMNLEYQVIFDEEFKASIFHMGIEIPVQTLSTGEMKKVDFVVLVAIMKLMKLKFSTINLLFLDELFSSVDPEGVYGILKILKKNTREMGLNIFVINHAPMPHEIFDWKLEVSKSNNFSSVTVNRF